MGQGGNQDESLWSEELPIFFSSPLSLSKLSVFSCRLFFFFCWVGEEEEFPPLLLLFRHRQARYYSCYVLLN